MVKAMSIMEISCESPLGHTYNSLTCGYLLADIRQASNGAGHSHGVQLPLGYTLTYMLTSMHMVEPARCSCGRSSA